MSGPAHQQLGLGLDLGPAAPETSEAVGRARPAGRVVRVRPDVVGIDRCFDYVVPEATTVELGDVVRIRLGGRAVRGWVVAVDVEPDPSHQLIRVTKVSGRGPTPELLDLADWAAWRWAGRPAHLLRTASPDANVERIGPPVPRPAPAASSVDPVIERALDVERAVLRWPPGGDRYGLVRAAIDATPEGRPLVLVPSAAEARSLALRLKRDGVGAALLAGDTGSASAGEWARARAGAVVVGTRSAAWAPVPEVGRVVVLDEHDESYQGDQTPTWHARDVVAERARRSGAACLLVSPTPTLDALAWGTVVDPGTGARRSGWPRIEVVDQRELDPALGPMFSPDLVRLLHEDGPVLCVLNRTGRVRVIACGSCRTVARCAECDAGVSSERAEPDDPGDTVLVCHRDATHRRPPVCIECGAGQFRNLRLGVGRAREELEALIGEPVGEVVSGGADPDRSTRVLIGTEAVLHRTERAVGVAFLDLDQHLLAVRYRAAEQTLALLARAARIVSRSGGRVLVQTRTPDHPVLDAVRRRDPAAFTDQELPLRRALGLPPTTALARVSGAGAPTLIAAMPRPDGLMVQGPVDGSWRVRAPDHAVLCDALAATPRPPDRVRIEVDPLGA